MIIVAGHLVVDAATRADYLRDCGQVVTLARAAPGCLDFALGADLVDPDRVNVYERWASRADLDAFRGSGPSQEQAVALRAVEVDEVEVPDQSGHR
ncbi:antibiotic biosynthesis monooxygenase [Nocardioides marinquilinus]|uniref:Antibiotic biosynthesis monooxygenase n=1 Tax=Nocardioides marinquilinus TaxID=1210400 RepID=A0ABP9PZM2_9ACTN